MGHEKLKQIKDNLTACIESQMCNLQEADADELGAAIDMLKDLEEALYYCTITEAMEGKGNSEFKYGGGQEPPIQYNNGGRSYYGGEMPMSHSNGNTTSSNMRGGNNRSSKSNYSEPLMRDYREGRSPEVRRMYMEAKEMHEDKASQMKELEHYMQELSSDIVDMIQEASTEEKQFLEKKLLTLASKIGQMK
jgi:hypothetical protein